MMQKDLENVTCKEVSQCFSCYPLKVQTNAFITEFLKAFVFKFLQQLASLPMRNGCPLGLDFLMRCFTCVLVCSVVGYIL